MAAHQAPPSLGFSRQEHRSGLPFPSPVHESEKWKWSRSVGLLSFLIYFKNNSKVTQMLIEAPSSSHKLNTKSSSSQIWPSAPESLENLLKIQISNHTVIKYSRWGLENCSLVRVQGFPGRSDGKESACNAEDPGSIPGSGRSPWRREWQPTLVFLPEFHGQRSLVG